MPKITKIVNKVDRGQVWVFIDGQYCASIRDRTFPAMGLDVGSEISCDKLKELESHHWKHSYGSAAWDKEKVRLEKVVKLIQTIDDRVRVDITGFGADSSKFIHGHPDEAGKPDLEVFVKDKELSILLVEVTGTEFMRGTTYWVRPDKLAYAKNHPEIDVWVILHYAAPVEKFVFLKPNIETDYTVSEKMIRGSKEHYIEFDDNSPEAVTFLEFSNHLKLRLAEVT